MAFLRRVADLGVDAPLGAGWQFVWWGCLLGLAYGGQALAYGGQALAYADWSPLRPRHLGVWWMAATVIGWGGHMFLVRPPGHRGGGALGNRLVRHAWMFGGAVMTGVGVSLRLAAGRAMRVMTGFLCIR